MPQWYLHALNALGQSGADTMNTKSRNRLLLILILSFPFLVLLGFVVSEALHGNR